MMSRFAACARMQWKILTLTASREDLLSLGDDHLSWGMVWVWLAGIGRTWDNADAHIFLKTGLPSVMYVLALAFFLWIFIGCLRPRNWTYKRLVTFIAMTGMPGLLYAIPLEMMLPPAAAADGNSLLLLLVAVWRVLMLGSFLSKTADLSLVRSLVALFLPLTAIIVLLIGLDRFEKTFGVMGGIRYMIKDEHALPKDAVNRGKPKEPVPAYRFGEPQPYPDLSGRAKAPVYRTMDYGPVPTGYREVAWDDPDYMPPTLMLAVLRPLGNISMAAFPILLLLYVVLIVYSWFAPKTKVKGETADSVAGAEAKLAPATEAPSREDAPEAS